MVTRNQRRRRAAMRLATNMVYNNTVPTVPPNPQPQRRRGQGRALRRRRQRQARSALLRECKAKGITLPPQPTSVDSAPVLLDEPGLPARVGMTEDGLHWAFKALHPNGEEVTSVVGIPDHVSVPVVSPEFRTNTIITASTNTTTDDIDIVALPFGDLAGIYRRYASGSATSRSANWKPIWNPTFETKVKALEEIGCLPAVDATGNVGSPTQFKVVAQESNIDAVYGYGRMLYKGVTIHLDAPATDDQGRITAGQLALPFKTDHSCSYIAGWYEKTKKAAPARVPMQIDSRSLGAVPLEPTCLTEACPGTATWEARKGCYLPIRFRDPVHQFESSGSESYLTVNSDGNEYGVGIGYSDPPSGYEDRALTMIRPKMLLNGLTGVILVRGISPKANVHVKMHTGVEAMVESCTTISPYQRMSPMLDVEAMNVVSRYSQELPQVFPASYNDLGGMIGAIVGLGKRVRKGIIDANIPLVSGWMDWQNRNIYDKIGLNSPMNSPDPLARVYDRMIGRRVGRPPPYAGLYA